MTALLRAELLKLATTRTFAAFVGGALVLSLLVTVLTVQLTSGFGEEAARDLFSVDLSSLFILLLGVMGMAGEWRHRTITSSILAVPDRVRLVVAKLIAFAAAGALLSLVVSVAVMVLGTVMLGARDEATLGIGELTDVLWRNLVVAALLGALGVAIGTLLRNQILGLVVVLVLSFIVEPMLIGLAPDVGRFGPTTGLPSSIADFQIADEELFSPGVAVLLMLSWIGVIGAAGTALLRGRDLV